jgi:glyoxylase-like metal-dependent hydrolase (beta-lactamase superfamily II)
MAIGDVETVDHGACSDLSLVDTGMYDTAGYGSVYLLDGDRPAIVETGLGTNYERILDALDVLGLPPDTIEVIAVTHVHLDHAGGAGHLARACEQSEVVVHEAGAPHLVDPGRLAEGTARAVGDLWSFYADPVPIPADRVRPVSDGERVDLGDHALVAHRASGHAPHQVVYHDPANEAVFTGDAAGVWVPSLGRTEPTTPPPGFDLEQALADLDLLRSLDPGTLLFSHFGPQTTPDATLSSYGERLRAWVEAVAAAREERSDEAVVDRFVEGTEMGEVWNERLARGVAAVDVRGVLHYLDG